MAPFASALNRWMRRTGVTWSSVPWALFRFAIGRWFLRLVFSMEERKRIVVSNDPVRYGSIQLAMQEITRDHLPGAIAECGVYRGDLSRFLHSLAPERSLFLFDTFAGFDSRDDLSSNDGRFRDTSVEQVLKNIGDDRNVIIRKGYFPQTAAGLEQERFALVILDFDKFDPSLEGLQFFYPRMTPGGYIFVHDVNSPESDWACSRALREFLADKPERLITIPDAWGSALFRKIGASGHSSSR